MNVFSQEDFEKKKREYREIRSDKKAMNFKILFFTLVFFATGLTTSNAQDLSFGLDINDMENHPMQNILKPCSSLAGRQDGRRQIHFQVNKTLSVLEK